MSTADRTFSPAFRDSDVIYLCIKRLEAVAQKMSRLEYDDELNTLMVEAGEWFDWLSQNVAAREAAQEPTC
jgi:hypothetical protein